MSHKLEFWKDVGACVIALAEAFTPVGTTTVSAVPPQDAAITAIVANPHDVWAAKASGMERERKLEEARTSVYTQTYQSLSFHARPQLGEGPRRKPKPDVPTLTLG